MQRIKFVAVALLLVGAFAVSLLLVSAFDAKAAAQNTNSSTTMSSGTGMQKSLYDRLGGEAAISAVVDEFAGRVLKDERINKKFAKTNAPRLLFFLKQQICAATGGPCKYEGLSMKASHKNMAVTEGEFNALVGHLVDTLDKFNVPAAEKNELLGILGPLKDQIVEVKGDATGTPLPPNFKPAKPLPASKAAKGPFNNKKGSKKGGGM